MSITYDIRNLQNCQDYKTKRADFFRTLHLQQKLNRNYEQAMNQRSQMEKLGVQPIGESPRSLEDEKKDLLLQQNLLLKNAMTIMKPDEARKLLFQLNNQEIYDFNTHFQGISVALQGRKNISADFIRRVFHRYMLVLKSTGGTGIPIPLTEETLSKLPADVVDAWENYARGTIDPTTGAPVNIDNLIRDTAEQLNRTPEDVAAEVKMEIDQEAQNDVPIQQLMKRKRVEVEAEARKKVKEEVEMETRGLKRVKEEEIFAPEKKFKVSEEPKGSLKRRMEDETEIIQQAIKRAKEGPGPEPMPFRRGTKRTARNTLETELVKRQKMMEMSKKRAGAPLVEEQKRPAKKLKEMYNAGAEVPLPPRTRLVPSTQPVASLEEAFVGYTPTSVLQEAKAEATRAIKRRATKRIKELTERTPSTARLVTRGSRETVLQKAKREAREAIQARAEARARELGQGTSSRQLEAGLGLFISPQESSTKSYQFIRPMDGRGLVQMGSRLIGSGIQPLTQDRYRQFGKYSIHMPSLQKGIMKIANVSRKHMIPPKMVGESFVHLIYKLLDDGVLDKTMYNGLDSEEQQYLIQIARLCNIQDTLGFGIKLTPQEQEDIKQFELLKGTIIAGNNDPTTLDELKRYILKFIHTGQIDRSFGQSLLCEIACLS